MEMDRANYISLKDATSLCDYSHDYLNLIARKGYLKALKIGRNWVTKREWLEDYLYRIEKKHGNGAGKVAAVEVASVIEIPLPKKNNIDGNLNSIRENMAIPMPLELSFGNRYSRRFVLGSFTSLVCLLGASIFFLSLVFISRKDIFLAASGGFIAEAAKQFDFFLRCELPSMSMAKASLGDAIAAAGRAVGTALKGAGDKIAEFANYVFFGRSEIVTVVEPALPPVLDKTVLEKSTDRVEQNIIRDIEGRVDQFRQEFGLEDGSPAAGDTEQAMIVVPSTGSEAGDEEIKKKIKQSFSDEVDVRPKDETSGVIVPDFGQKGYDPYLYLLVPLSDKN